jgi:hypothetical protein
MTIPAHKQAELDRITEELDAHVVTSQGWTRGDLMKAFDKLTAGMDNWRDPIDTVIRKEDYEIMNEAVLFLCGCELVKRGWVCRMGAQDREFYRVAADGYYKTIGA